MSGRVVGPAVSTSAPREATLQAGAIPLGVPLEEEALATTLAVPVAQGKKMTPPMARVEEEEEQEDLQVEALPAVLEASTAEEGAVLRGTLAD